MTKEQLEQGKALDKYIGWVGERLEKLTQKCGNFYININISNGSKPEYIDVMDFLSKEDVESVRKLILERITENFENASRRFAEL